MTNEIVTIENHNMINLNDEKTLATLKQTVAKGATNEEFAMFVNFCKGTGLNPFKKEIWFIKTSRGVQLMTGINGFFSIANNHPQFDGYETGLVAPDGSYVSQSYPKSDYIGSWCKVYRKDRRVPTEAVTMLAEYDKKQSIWISMKRIMIQKCAESVALRKAFPQELNGLYTQEEMPVDYKPKSDIQAGADAERGFDMIGVNELPSYVINDSPNAPHNIQGQMLCDIDPDFFDEMSADKSLANSFGEKDLAHMREYYMKFLHKPKKKGEKVKSYVPTISKERQEELEQE